jgi:alpha-glucosidase
MTIPMLTNLSISGVPFVGADVGGFVETPSAELYTRWLQAAALTPFFRTHSAIDTEPREPWSFGADYEKINRESIELRYRLLPYLYTAFASEETDGNPVMRPLWFDYPHDVKTYLREDEFLAGRDILVAPIVHPRQTKRMVYFPKGDTWIDWRSGKRYTGGEEKEVDAPLDRLPMFVRAGASIATQPVVQSTNEMTNVSLTIAVAIGADGSSGLYQDAGDGYAYRTGDFHRTTFTLKGKTLRIEAKGSARFQSIGFVEFVGIDTAPASVVIDGKTIHDVHFDAATRRVRVAVSAGAKEITLK